MPSERGRHCWKSALLVEIPGRVARNFPRRLGESRCDENPAGSLLFLRLRRTLAPSARGDQFRDAPLDVIANRSNNFYWLILRIRQRPVIALQAGHVRALISAAHRDEHGRSAREILGQPLRAAATEVNTCFAHHVDDDRMDAIAGLGPRRNGLRARGIGELTKERSRHLRAAGIVDTRKDDSIHGAQQAYSRAGAVAACGMQQPVFFCSRAASFRTVVRCASVCVTTSRIVRISVSLLSASR